MKVLFVFNYRNHRPTYTLYSICIGYRRSKNIVQPEKFLICNTVILIAYRA